MTVLGLSPVLAFLTGILAGIIPPRLFQPGRKSVSPGESDWENVGMACGAASVFTVATAVVGAWHERSLAAFFAVGVADFFLLAIGYLSGMIVALIVLTACDAVIAIRRRWHRAASASIVLFAFTVMSLGA